MGSMPGAFVTSSHTHSGADITSGTVADARLSTNVDLLSSAQTVTGVKTFNPSTGSVPFAVVSSKNSMVANLNAGDSLDGSHGTAFVGAGQANSITTGMIQNGAVTDANITGPISGAKISSTGLNEIRWMGFMRQALCKRQGIR